MNKLVSLAIAAIWLTSPIAAKAVPVTWSFFETAITSCNGGAINGVPACVLPPQPFVLMTLTLPDSTSTGTATWPGNIVSFGVSPVYTGDSFALVLPFTPGPHLLTPAFAGNTNVPCGIGQFCDFDISWTEVAGVLTAVNINVLAANDEVGGLAGHGFGLSGGELGSDGTLGGCTFTQCTVSGFWQSDLAVPEPMSAVLLITGLLGTYLVSRARLSRPPNPAPTLPPWC